MRSKVLLFACLGFSIGIIACGDSSTGPSEPDPGPEGYYPMDVGYAWQFDLVGEVSDNDGDWDITGNETWNVTANPTHDQGFKVYQVSVSWEETWTPSGGGTSTTYSDSYTDYVYVDANIVRWYDELSSTEYVVDLELPLATGNSWDYYPDYPGFVVAEVMTLSASVDVPAGNFDNCAHISFDYGQSPDDYMNRYYADGAGMISQVVHWDHGTTDAATYEYELTSFTY
ncbi:hypothetical protein JW921_05835 [Candidatus Fermentibacterales bacterium]|nr:hypothetical protein [Candidatus Fermentibacterales bacterium]